MKGAKVISLLQSLHPKEMSWLAKWVRSPYNNSNKLVIALFGQLRKYAPAFDSDKLSKEKVFEQLFPGQPFDDQRLRLLMFRLSELVESFLVAQRLKRSRLLYQELLQAELGERNQYELFLKKNQTLAEELDKSPFRDEYYYLGRWQQQNSRFFHPQAARYQFEASQLQDAMHHLDAFYVLSKLRYGTELRNRQNILPEEYEIPLLEECRQLAGGHPGFQNG